MSEEKEGYNTDFDVVVQTIGPVPGTKFLVDMVSYNGGEPKLRVSRSVGAKEKTRQLFRLPPAEALLLAEFLVNGIK